MISQAEAYERGVRDAATLFLDSACIDRDGTVTLDRDHSYYVEKQAALLQANPYRAVVETEAKE